MVIEVAVVVMVMTIATKQVIITGCGMRMMVVTKWDRANCHCNIVVVEVVWSVVVVMMMILNWTFNNSSRKM